MTSARRAFDPADVRHLDGGDDPWRFTDLRASGHAGLRFVLCTLLRDRGARSRVSIDDEKPCPGRGGCATASAVGFRKEEYAVNATLRPP